LSELQENLLSFFHFCSREAVEQLQQTISMSLSAAHIFLCARLALSNSLSGGGIAIAACANRTLKANYSTRNISSTVRGGAFTKERCQSVHAGT
jgi:hypothetical protein